MTDSDQSRPSVPCDHSANDFSPCHVAVVSDAGWSALAEYERARGRVQFDTPSGPGFVADVQCDEEGL